MKHDQALWKSIPREIKPPFKHSAFLFTLPPERRSAGLLVWAAVRSDCLTETTMQTLNYCFKVCTNNSLSFRGSHDSTATLIPSYCSFSMWPQLHHKITLEGKIIKRIVETEQEELSKRSQQAKKNCLFSFCYHSLCTEAALS